MFLSLLLALAPVPRPVERLTPELLPGRWECRWGQAEAWFCFRADGTYAYGTGDIATHVGEWSIRDGEARLPELHLTERSIGANWWTEYTVGSIDMRRYPTVKGEVRASTPYPCVLLNPRRFAE